MDGKLFNHIQNSIPKINDDIVKGVAVKQMGQVETYMDEIWRAVAKSFPDNLKYVGSKRCSPEEEFNLLIKTYSSNVYNFDPSSIFIVKYRLECIEENGTVNTINVPLCLPYVYKGGQLWINGTKYTVSPVLTTNLFSAEGEKLFAKLKVKICFSRLSHSFMADNKRIVASVVFSTLHIGAAKHRKENNQDSRTTVSPEPTMVHYLLMEYGITGLFEKLGARVVYGTAENMSKLGSDWVCCTAYTIRPASAKCVKDEPHPDIAIAIPRSDMEGESKELFMSILAGFFYIVNHFPGRVKVEYLDEPRMWKTLLGITYFGRMTNGEGVLIEQMDNHISTLKEYIDITTKMALVREKIDADDIYELFIYVIKTMQSKLWNTDPSTLYNKKLQTLQYVLSEITKGITRFMFDIVKMNKGRVTTEEVRNIIRNKVKMHAFFKDYAKHKEIELISSPCDLFAFEHTTKMIPPAAIKTKSHATGLNNPSNQAHVSIAEVGSYTNLHGVDATGRGYLNPFLELTDDDTVVRSERFRELTDHVQSKLTRK